MPIALPTRRLVSQNDAAMIQNANVPRSKFVGTWTHKTTIHSSLLVPIMVDEIVPGDHMVYDLTAYIRMATPLFPIFDNLRIDTFFFFVPCRLLWTNWVKFMGEQTSPGDSIAYTIPQLVSAAGGFPRNTIFDHMGLPGTGQVGAGDDISVNALPLRAYNKIYNTWFRDQNIQNGVIDNVDDGPDAVADFAELYRGKGHDYFTTALPWPQKFTAPSIPLSGNVPVIGLGAISQDANNAAQDVWETNAGAVTSYAFYKELWNVGAPNETLMRMSAASGGTPQVFADLSQATGVAINTFRQAFLVQQLLERDARGGTRYVELIRSHFGVTNPDFRLQRPEYIGGGQTPLIITPIAQTAPTAGVPLGALGAAGTAAGSHRASYAATEHGYVLALLNVRSELSYQQGLHKMWSRSTRYDFYWPALAGLGEQAILRKEIYCTGAVANDEVVFGYQERWHEYRTRVSEVSGMFRSTTAATLDAWHLAQKFTSAPTLSDAFISDIPPFARILAAGAAANDQQFLADFMIERTATRPIPSYGTPVTLGRF